MKSEKTFDPIAEDANPSQVQVLQEAVRALREIARANSRIADELAAARKATR